MNIGKNIDMLFGKKKKRVRADKMPKMREVIDVEATLKSLTAYELPQHELKIVESLLQREKTVFTINDVRRIVESENIKNVSGEPLSATMMHPRNFVQRRVCRIVTTGKSTDPAVYGFEPDIIYVKQVPDVKEGVVLATDPDVKLGHATSLAGVLGKFMVALKDTLNTNLKRTESSIDSILKHNLGDFNVSFGRKVEFEMQKYTEEVDAVTKNVDGMREKLEDSIELLRRELPEEADYKMSDYHQAIFGHTGNLRRIRKDDTQRSYSNVRVEAESEREKAEELVENSKYVKLLEKKSDMEVEQLKEYVRYVTHLIAYVVMLEKLVFDAYADVTDKLKKEHEEKLEEMTEEEEEEE